MSKGTDVEETGATDAPVAETPATDPSVNGASAVQFAPSDTFIDIARQLISHLMIDPLADTVTGVRGNVEFICKKVGKSAVRIDWRRFTPPASE